MIKSNPPVNNNNFISKIPVPVTTLGRYKHRNVSTSLHSKKLARTSTPSKSESTGPSSSKARAVLKAAEGKIIRCGQGNKENEVSQTESGRRKCPLAHTFKTKSDKSTQSTHSAEVVMIDSSLVGSYGDRPVLRANRRASSAPMKTGLDNSTQDQANNVGQRPVAVEKQCDNFSQMEGVSDPFSWRDAASDMKKVCSQARKLKHRSNLFVNATSVSAFGRTTPATQLPPKATGRSPALGDGFVFGKPKGKNGTQMLVNATSVYAFGRNTLSTQLPSEANGKSPDFGDDFVFGKPKEKNDTQIPFNSTGGLSPFKIDSNAPFGQGFDLMAQNMRRLCIIK